MATHVADARARRILVVDDTEGNRYATSRTLRGAGYTVSEAETGSKGIATAMSERPDLIVLDVNLPDMTGFEVVERLRATLDSAEIPVLHLSASYTTYADQARGLELGADAYLTHPIDPGVFLATVAALLRASAADRRLQDAAREWQATFDALTDPVVLLDLEVKVRRANNAASRLFRCDAAELLGRPIAELIDPLSPGETSQLVDRLLEGRPFDKLPVQIGGRVYHVTTSRVDHAADDARMVCVMVDVSVRMAAEQERETLLTVAEQARGEAEAANHAKNDFLAVMSHELRTPLNAIGGYAQLIELGIRGPVTDAQRLDLGRIRRSQTYLLSLINDVLNFARIEAGHLQLELKDVMLGELVTGMEDFVQPQLKERDLTFQCHPCTSDVTLRTDPDKVQQILINLLSNALKFTPVGGTIVLACRVENGSVLITVEDNGGGIAPDKLETIFEPFVQVDRRYKRAQEGIGLGLAISRELARAMGGDLRVRSAPASGARFELNLPFAPPEQP